MNSKAQQSMNDALSRVFDTSTFLCAYPIEDSAEVPERAETVGASIQWFGPQNGKLILLVDRNLLNELASNMLGATDEAEFTAEQSVDALKEVLNMICGNFLTSCYGEQSVFDLTPPEWMSPVVVQSAQTAENNARVRFNLDETLGELIMQVDHDRN